MFNGELNACVFDINTGNFDGKASVKLESDIVYKNSFITVSIPAERRQRETVVNATIASSKIETLSGTVTYHDAVFGDITVDCADLDDMVLIKPGCKKSGMLIRLVLLAVKKTGSRLAAVERLL